jgi:hypothetical protein
MIIDLLSSFYINNISLLYFTFRFSLIDSIIIRSTHSINFFLFLINFSLYNGFMSILLLFKHLFGPCISA